VKTPQRGEVWLVDLGMTAKVRPGLVVSIPSDDVDRALVTPVPHTTSVRGSRFEAAVQVGFLKAGAFDTQSVVTIPHARLLHVLGKLNTTQLGAVEAVLRTWLGLGSSEV
jgi:mRNA interferase MazF